MSLDAYTTRVFGKGTVIVSSDGTIVIEGFEGVNASCRDVGVLACAWAIGELQREMVAMIEQPGGTGNVCVN